MHRPSPLTVTLCLLQRGTVAEPGVVWQLEPVKRISRGFEVVQLQQQLGPAELPVCSRLARATTRSKVGTSIDLTHTLPTQLRGDPRIGSLDAVQQEKADKLSIASVRQTDPWPGNWLAGES